MIDNAATTEKKHSESSFFLHQHCCVANWIQLKWCLFNQLVSNWSSRLRTAQCLDSIPALKMREFEEEVVVFLNKEVEVEEV